MPELNDKLVAKQNEYFDRYYSSNSIHEAEEALQEFATIANELGEKGAKSESVLWATYFRLAEIKRLQGEAEESESMVQQATTYFAKLEHFQSGPKGEDKELIATLLASVDEQRGMPIWKMGLEDVLF